MRVPIFLMLVFLYLSGCRQHPAPSEETLQQTEALLEAVVTATLELDPGLNTDSLWFDCTSRSSAALPGLDRFLSHHPEMRRVNADSLLRHDSLWLNRGYLSRTLLYIDSLQYRGQGKWRVLSSKTKATDGSIRAEILLQKQDRSFRVLRQSIISIS